VPYNGVREAQTMDKAEIDVLIDEAVDDQVTRKAGLWLIHESLKKN
jgi:hypothetical protein